MAINPHERPLDEQERRAFDQIVRDLKEDGFNVEAPRRRRKLGPLGYTLLGSLLFAGVSGYLLDKSEKSSLENSRRTAKAVEQVLESNHDLTQLGVCKAELSAQQEYLDKSAYAPRDYRAKPEGGWYKDAASRMGVDGVPCAPDQTNPAVTVEVDGVKVTITPSDVVDFSTQTWCAERNPYDTTVFAIGEQMMQAAGMSCTDTAIPLPSMTTR